jgi:site-specific recombinase XerD
MATLQDYRRRFEKYLLLKNNAQNTIDCYVGIVTQFICHFKKDPRAINQSMIGDYLLQLKSTRYKRQTWYCLANFYANVLNEPNWMNGIPLPKQEKTIPETLNHVEILKMVATIQNLKHRSIITLIYACGLRISESVGLRIADIDGTRLQIHIRQSKVAKDRIIPIPLETLNLLRQYFSEYRPKEYLFNGQNSLQYDVRSIQQIFHRAKRAAGIRKKISVHTLRHSRANELLRQGVDATLIQKFLGHSSIKTTQEYYLHTNINDLAMAIGRADILLTNQKLIAA